MNKETAKQGAKTTKAEIALLGKIFADEINQAITGNHFPYQTKSKLIERLCDEGLVEKVEVTLPGRFPVIIRGYCLTHFGHAYYCISC